MAIEALGGDPGEVERGLIVENLKRAPEIQERLKQRVFQKLGLMDEQALGPVGGVPPERRPACPAGRCPRPAACRGSRPSWPRCWRRVAWGPPGWAPGPGGPGAGQGGIGLPGVIAPGYGMPLTPTPSGVNGATGLAGVPGGPSQPNTPARHRPLPGQGPVG